MLKPVTMLAVGVLGLTAPHVAQVTPGAREADAPAARRLEEVIAAVGSGSSARIRAFVRVAYAPEVWQRMNEDRVVQLYTTLYDRSRGFEIDSLRATPTEAAALLRAKLTGLWESLSVRVEPEPPHRIVDVASFSIKSPKHPLADAEVSDAERVREIERIARRLSDADAFSGVVLLAKGDSILYLGAFGEAEKKRGIPVRPDTRFALASITKTFVSVALAKLAREGKLSWDDPLGKFLPDFPPPQAREKVRIKHLVTHTSGLREIERSPQRPDSMDDYVRMVELAQADSLLYEPGTRSAYTNANYSLLGKIIEVASGQPFYQYIRERIFRPAGMEQTDFDAPGDVPPPLAVAYAKQYTDAGVRFASNASASARQPAASYPEAYTGAHSTAHDLFRFARALRSGRILRPVAAELLFSPKPEAGNWSYGFDILDEERGLVGHGGSRVGMSNSLDMFTRSDYTSVILSNYTYARSPLREAIWTILP
jgi:CubicO group peptidase (beta-lactamase class C family)